MDDRELLLSIGSNEPEDDAISDGLSGFISVLCTSSRSELLARCLSIVSFSSRESRDTGAKSSLSSAGDSRMTLLSVIAVLLCVVGDGDVLAAVTPCQVVTIFSLKTSDCERLGLTSVPVDLDADVKVMRLADNRIATVRDNAFSVYSTLQELYLARNRIVVVSPNAFRGLRNLQIVDLSGNRLTAVRADFLRHVTSVRSLSFASNPLVVVESTALRPLVRLERVSFAGGRLTRLDGHVFGAATRLTEIDVSGNRLARLPADMRRSLPTSLRVFRFYGNPWTCDCRLRWLRRWTATRPAVNWDFARNTPTCAAPPLLRSVSWRHLDVSQFACPTSVLLNSSTSVQVIISSQP